MFGKLLLFFFVLGEYTTQHDRMQTPRVITELLIILFSLSLEEKLVTVRSPEQIERQQRRAWSGPRRRGRSRHITELLVVPEVLQAEIQLQYV